jgi:predicted nucleic acid-binding protein
MPSVYVETTIPSYLVALPSRDLVVAGHQQITHQWWAQAKSRFELYVSEAVIAEVSAGEHKPAAERIRTIQRLPILRLNEEVRRIARIYSAELGLPAKALTDALHIAYAAAYEMDYLATWNCAHIANGAVIRRLLEINSRRGIWTPTLVTPEALFEPDEEALS